MYTKERTLDRLSRHFFIRFPQHPVFRFEIMPYAANVFIESLDLACIAFYQFILIVPVRRIYFLLQRYLCPFSVNSDTYKNPCLTLVFYTFPDNKIYHTFRSCKETVYQS